MRIGIDLGGTKIEAIALDDDGNTLARERIDTPRGDYAATLRAVAGLVSGVERHLGRTGSVGVGIPGALSPRSGRVKNANSTWLIGQALDVDLAGVLGRQVRLMNDANCLAVSESVDGAAAGAQVVFAAILGTGVGGGVAIDGRALTGRHAIAGEWGHNPLPWPGDTERPGPACYCGRRGCIETFCSGPALARDHAGVTGEQCDAVTVAARARAGDGAAAATLERLFDRLARALAGVINVLDPDAIVLGGGLSNIEPLYAELPARLGRHVFSDHCTTPVLRARHGDSSGVRGAAWLW